MPSKINIGVIGCGKIAHVDHVPGLQKLKNVAITALYDVREDRMQSLKESFQLSATCHADEQALLGDDLDAVVICTPNSLHYPQTMAALKAGKHVLCEKPMAANSSACTRMIAAAQAAGKILHLNHTLHYWPPYITLAKWVSSGKIGTVQHVRCIRFHDSSPDIGWSPGATWFVSKAFDGGIVLDIGVHMAELMKWAVGPVVEVVSATDTRISGLDVADKAVTLMRFKNGVTGVLELSWSSPVNTGLIEVYGSKGVLRLGFAPDGGLDLVQSGKGGGTPVTVRPKLPRPVPNSQTAFVNAILGKAPSPTPGELGREAVALCEAILKSGELRRAVPVKQF